MKHGDGGKLFILVTKAPHILPKLPKTVDGRSLGTLYLVQKCILCWGLEPDKVIDLP